MTAGHHLSALFDVEADHVGRGDDAGRGRQAHARRSRFKIHPGLCRREGRRREARRRRQAARLRSSRSIARSRSKTCCATPRASPTASTATPLCENSMQSSESVRWRFRQRHFRRASREAAAGRTAGNAVGLRPFDRRARPRHRGGIRTVAVSVREAAAARSARDDRHRVLRRRCGAAAAHRRADAGRSLDQSGRRHQGSDLAAALGIRRRRHGRDDRRLCTFRADAAERRHAGRQALPQTRDHRPDDVGSYRAGDQDRPRPVLFSRRYQRLWSWLCRAHRGARRIRRGHWANIAGTASPAPSFLSIRRTICSRSSWCRRRRSADGFNWR